MCQKCVILGKIKIKFGFNFRKRKVEQVFGNENAARHDPRRAAKIKRGG